MRRANSMPHSGGRRGRAINLTYSGPSESRTSLGLPAITVAGGQLLQDDGGNRADLFGVQPTALLSRFRLM